MKTISTTRRSTGAVLPVILVLFLALTIGCTQPLQQEKAPAAVNVSRVDAGHLVVTYPGSTATANLLELEITVTDSAGNAQTKSIGDRYSTTPLRFGATETLTGSFGGKNHVLITGYFMDSSKKIMLDTTV